MPLATRSPGKITCEEALGSGHFNQKCHLPRRMPRCGDGPDVSAGDGLGLIREWIVDLAPAPNGVRFNLAGNERGAKVVARLTAARATKVAIADEQTADAAKRLKIRKRVRNRQCFGRGNKMLPEGRVTKWE